MKQDLKNTTEKKIKKEKAKNRGFLKYLIVFWSLFSLAILFIVLLFWMISSGKLGYMPTFEELDNPKSNLASEIYSEDNVLLGKFYIENRSNTKFAELDTNLVNALIATEDIRFHDHSGIDFRALLRAASGALMGKNKGGGSTITQQFAKLLFHERPDSKAKRVMQKLNEWVIAVKLERRYSKDEIIEMYLNKFDFVNNAIGIKSSAKIYFDTSPDSLKLEESAILIGMLKNPALYNPVRRPDTVKFRRNVVLGQMLKYGYLNQEMYDSVKQLPVDMSKFGRQDHISGQATYFREHLRSELKKWCKNHYKADGAPYNLYKDGLKIFTTINSTLQQYAEEAVVEHLSLDLQPAFFRHWKGHTNAPFYFENNADEAILLQKATGRDGVIRAVDSLIIRNCTFNHCGNGPKVQALITVKGDKDSSTVDANILVENVTTYNSFPTVVLVDECDNTIVRNLIVASPDTTNKKNKIVSIEKENSSLSNICAFNVAPAMDIPDTVDTWSYIVENTFEITAGRYTFGAPGTVDVATIYNFDPMFANAANGDLTLQSGSPAYGKAHDGGALGDLRWATNASSVARKASATPDRFTISQNYPNPFNPTTTISYSLDKKSNVKLQIFDITGGLVETLVNGTNQAGFHTVSWDASNTASGIYFYQIMADGQSITRKMTLLK